MNIATGGKVDAIVQPDAVAIGEFAEAVAVERLDEHRRLGVQWSRVDGDAWWNGGFVITDAGKKMQQAQCLFERGPLCL